MHIVVAVFEFQDHLKKTIKNPNKSLWREIQSQKIARVVKFPQALILAPLKCSNHLSKKIKEFSMGPVHFTATELKQLLL